MAVVCTQCVPFAPPTNDPREQLDQLESEIARLEHMLASLVQRRPPLKCNVNRHYSPMLALPSEICCEIFSACFPPDLSTWGKTTPLLLGSVCTAWRNLAWSMPWLWNTIYLSKSHLSDIHPTLVEEWISRSAHRPLSITLRLSALKYTLSCPACPLSQIMNVLFANSSRWYTIDIDVPSTCPISTHSDQTPLEFPLLTSASMAVSFPHDHQLDLFLRAPLLHDVTLRNFQLEYVSLPFQQVTHLHLNPTTVRGCLSVLKSFPNLTHCTFESITYSDVVDPVITRSSSLVVLNIINSTSTPLSEILDSIVIPNAKELEFCVTGSPFSSWSFGSLITRSCCDLQRLSLRGLRISERQLWNCLQAIPSLLSLSVKDIPELGQNTIRILNPQHQVRSASPTCLLLPLLIELCITSLASINAEDIVSMLEARWMGENNVARLRKFRFVKSGTPMEVDPKYSSRVAQLAKEGLDLSFVDGEQSPDMDP